MNTAIEVIKSALKAPDRDGHYWLAQITALLSSPTASPHRKALEITKAYLEAFHCSTETSDKPPPGGRR